MNNYLLMIISLIGILLVGLPAAWILDTDMPFSIVVASTGIVSFFGLYRISLADGADMRDKEASLRFAIAGSIVIEYLVLVAVVAFFKEGPGELPIITQTMLSNFTAVVGVVVAFYFGSSAYVQASAGREKDAE